MTGPVTVAAGGQNLAAHLAVPAQRLRAGVHLTDAGAQRRRVDLDADAILDAGAPDRAHQVFPLADVEAAHRAIADALDHVRVREHVETAETGQPLKLGEVAGEGVVRAVCAEVAFIEHDLVAHPVQAAQHEIVGPGGQHRGHVRV
ncbi:MAG: hypothetical protein DWB48_07070, partial [Nitrosomonas sp.]|nr:hypothetical protein [Nitrosomonas sp.]